MRRLYKSSALASARRDVILFWVPGGMQQMLHVEGAIAAALKLRGQNMHAVICDGVFSACVKREISDPMPLDQWNKTCGPCKRVCSNKLSELGIEHSFIGDYVSKQNLINAEVMARKVTWSSIEGVRYLGVTLGQNIKSSILRYLKGHELPIDQHLVREYAFSGLVCAEAARNAYKKWEPSRVFMSHGVYVDWGPALHTALVMDIPVTAWMASYLPARFYLRHINDGIHIDFHNMTCDAWNDHSARDLAPEQLMQLDTYLDHRYLRDVSFDMKDFKRYVGEKAEIFARYSLDEARPVWGIMAHINWDAVSDYAPMLYESFNEWILETIAIATEVSEVQWLLKVHPAEAWDNPDSGVESLIRKKLPELPSNIRILSAEENISPLDFFNLVDGAVTVYGTAGLELAVHGKPVILAGEAHYGKKGFTLDADSQSVYTSLLRQTAKISRLSASQILLAKKYAYCYFILRQIPLRVVKSPSSKWWDFQFDQIECLIAGKDPAMDFLCDRLINGKDFIMSPSLEAQVNKLMH
jgi:hypothetical protein